MSQPQEAAVNDAFEGIDEFDFSQYAPTPAPPTASAVGNGFPNGAPAGAPQQAADEDMFAGLFGDEDDDDEPAPDHPRGGAAPGSAARAPAGTSGVAGLMGSTPIWPDWSAYANDGVTYHVRITRMTGTGAEEQLGELPAFAPRVEVAKRWGPGQYLARPVDHFGRELNIPNTPYILNMPPDHIYFQDQARHSQGAGGTASGAGSSVPPYMMSMPSNDAMFSYLSAERESQLARDLEEKRLAAQREAAVASERASLDAARAGLADKTITHHTDLVKDVMLVSSQRLDKAADAERQQWQAFGAREREASERHLKLQTDGLGMIMSQMQTNMEAARLQFEREREERREERDRRDRAEREEREERRRREEQDRKDREHRDRMDALAREAREAEERRQQREHQQAMQAAMQAQMNASNPVNSIMTVITMATPLIAMADKVGFLDGIKDRISGRGSEPAGGWSDVGKTLIETVGEVAKEAFKGGGAPFLAEEDDEDEGELFERPDGLLQDEEGRLYHPETEEELTVLQAQAWLEAQARAALGAPGGAAMIEETPIDPREVEAEQERQRIAAQVDAEAYRPVGGPAAVAAARRAASAANAGSGGNGAGGVASNGANGANGASAQHPATLAGVPKPQQKMARAIMIALVRKLNELPEDDWKAVTIKAVKHDPAAMNAYLRAMTIRGAAAEAGASPGLVDRYLAKLETIDGLYGVLLKDVPRG